MDSHTVRQAGSKIRYAVVLKTYAWDDFIERQARRCAESSTGGDFFLSIDETRQGLEDNSLSQVVRIRTEDLTRTGLPLRAEEGSLLWWNADYPHYHFHQLHPEYDFYIFVEYDALYRGDFRNIVTHLAAKGIDFAAFALPESKETWHWTKRHAGLYSIATLEGCLMCISAFSHRALAHLLTRRLAMSKEQVPYWPSAEVFVPTEIKRAGLVTGTLETCGDTTGFSWHGPHLETEVIDGTQPAFLHPVYDQQRFSRWALAQGQTLRDFFDPNGPVLTPLSRLALRAYCPQLMMAAAKALRASWKQRTSNLWLRGVRPRARSLRQLSSD